MDIRLRQLLDRCLHMTSSARTYSACGAQGVARTGTDSYPPLQDPFEELDMATPDTRMPHDRMLNSGGLATPVNVIHLLKSDHRQVDAWFSQFFVTDDPVRKQVLAERICTAIEVHARIEEEIFYPAFLDATGNEDLHDDAVDDHDTAMELILKIRLSPGPREDDFYNAKMKVLAETIRDHVREEEMPGGMFEQAANAGVDLETLGLEIEHRRIELMAGAGTSARYDAASRRTDLAVDDTFDALDLDDTMIR